MKTNLKKGFTLVELVIVIAVIGILAAVLVPTFVDLVRKANLSNDTILVKNLNTALVSESAISTPTTPEDVMVLMESNGFTVSKMTPRSSGEIVWDSENNRFALVEWQNGAFKIVYADNDKISNNAHKVWVLRSQIASTDEVVNAGYSVYLKPNFNGNNITVYGGVDVGDNTNINITYDRSSNVSQADRAQTVVIRTVGDGTKLTINAPKDSVDFYGFASEMNVTAIDNHSLHLYGSVNELSVEAGHVVVEQSGVVFDVVQVGAKATGEGASITNNGYIAAATLSDNDAEVREDIEIQGQEVGGDYEISTLSQLETFRDTVNAGNSFVGLNVKLTSDITLNDGWKPIGEGNRSVGKSNYIGSGNPFKGNFDGQNHTIYNLNNKGYVPTLNRIINVDGEREYAYGLFALVYEGASIENLTIRNVDIDSTRYAGANIDSVGALIGYSDGSITIDNVKAFGKINASDSVAGIVGRSYQKINENATLTISNCVNNIAVSASNAKSGKAAGIIAYAYVDTINMSNNINNGNVQSALFASGIVLFGLETGSVTLTNNSNSGSITIPNGKNIASYIAGPASKSVKFLEATNNTNTGKAYAGTTEINVKLVVNVQNGVTGTEMNVVSD